MGKHFPHPTGDSAVGKRSVTHPFIRHYPVSVLRHRPRSGEQGDRHKLIAEKHPVFVPRCGITIAVILLEKLLRKGCINPADGAFSGHNPPELPQMGENPLFQRFAAFWIAPSVFEEIYRFGFFAIFRANHPSVQRHEEEFRLMAVELAQHFVLGDGMLYLIDVQKLYKFFEECHTRQM